MTLPAPHPAFVAHFTDPLYEHESLETAPFGSDEGSDVVHVWGGQRDRLGRDATIADLMGLEPQDVDDLLGEMSGIDYLDQAAIVRGAAFTLLRLVGHLAPGDLDRALRSLHYEIETTADPDWLPADAREQLLGPLLVQRADLLSWRETFG